MDNEETKDKMDDIMAKAKILADQASKKAGEIAQVVGEKTGQFIDFAKKKIEIEKIEYALAKKYKELGKSYYTAKKESKELDDDKLLTEIDTLLDALDVLNTVETEPGETTTE